eukprot:scaffold11639_cov65-Phaeocystis_antarctica.AAC.2
MVELRAGAVAAVVVGGLMRREVLADVPVLPPLREQQARHLLAEGLPPRAHDGHVVVRLQRASRQAIDELRHRAPDVAAPVAQRREGRVASLDGRQTPVAFVRVACEVTARCNAEVVGREQPLAHHAGRLVDSSRHMHAGRLLVGGCAGEHRVEGGGRDAPTEGTIPEAVREDAA